MRQPASLLLLSLTLSAGAAFGQTGAANGEWRFYGGDAGGTRYSALSQIHAGNVKDLAIAWRWKAQNFGRRPEINWEVTPLFANGVLYFTAGTRRDAVAIDAATGETLWMYRLDEGVRGSSAVRFNNRGLAWWSDGKGDDRVVLISPGYQLIALHAKTGLPVENFGSHGIVDLFEGLDRPEMKPGQIGSTSPPIIVRDVVVVGGALAAGTAPSSKQNVPGYVRGYNVRTGERVWTFHTIPQAGEFGNQTWQQDSWKYTGNTAVWAPMSADEELGYVYLPVETPTGDYYGGHRPGDNLFAESLVCLDARTGRRIWHYQFIHHGVWDWDIPTAPTLLNITVGGRAIKAVAQITKQAFVYVFDRVTGQPVWPIEERPVPQSDTPGEKTSPTQPFPSRPAPFDRQGFSEADLIDFTPELKAEALKIASQYRMGPIFTPPSVIDANGKKGTLMLPATVGGGNWQGGVADPETGILYVPSVTSPSTAALVKGAPRSDMDWVARMGTSAQGPRGLPLVKPPWGTDHRHRPQHRRPSLDAAERLRAGGVPAESGAQGNRPESGGQSRTRSAARHQDPALLRRWRRLVQHSARRRRTDVPCPGQEDRAHPLRNEAPRQRDRHPDDLPDGREAVHRGRHRRGRSPGGTDRAGSGVIHSILPLNQL